MQRYVSPVNPAVYPHLAVTLLSIGLFFMAWFFVYPITCATVLCMNNIEISQRVVRVGGCQLKGLCLSTC